MAAFLQQAGLLASRFNPSFTSLHRHGKTSHFWMMRLALKSSKERGPL
jgi:hypothetical protein